MTVKELKTIVRRGEGTQLEFKRKVNHVGKILREVVAFANSHGGQLLVGIADGGEIVGVRDPEEIIQTVAAGMENIVQPPLHPVYITIPLTMKRSVVLIRINEGPEKPYFLVDGSELKDRAAYYRWKDKSIQASKELTTILRRQRKLKNGYLLEYGDPEDAAMKYFKKADWLTLSTFQHLSGLDQKEAAEVLIGLVLANVLAINPRESEDVYTPKI